MTTYYLLQSLCFPRPNIYGSFIQLYTRLRGTILFRDPYSLDRTKPLFTQLSQGTCTILFRDPCSLDRKRPLFTQLSHGTCTILFRDPCSLDKKRPLLTQPSHGTCTLPFRDPCPLDRKSRLVTQPSQGPCTILFRDPCSLDRKRPLFTQLSHGTCTILFINPCSLDRRRPLCTQLSHGTYTLLFRRPWSLDGKRNLFTPLSLEAPTLPRRSLSKMHNVFLEVLRLNEGWPDQRWQNEHEAMGVVCRQDMDSVLHAVAADPILSQWKAHPASAKRYASIQKPQDFTNLQRRRGSVDQSSRVGLQAAQGNCERHHPGVPRGFPGKLLPSGDAL